MHFLGDPYLFLIVYLIYMLGSFDLPSRGFFDFVVLRIVVSTLKASDYNFFSFTFS